MKVLFMFGGLPHYYNLVLNKLNRIEGIELMVVVPKAKGNTVGEGVYQTTKGIEFKVRTAEEYKAFYGKAFFKDFDKILLEENPDIVVTGWPYVIGFLLNSKLKKVVKELNIKLILKEIPFRVPKYHNARRFYREEGDITEDLQTNLKRGGLLFTLKYDLLTQIRKMYYNLMDAHVNYVEDAYEILGSYGVSKEKIFVTYNSPDTDIILETKSKIEHLPPVLVPNNYRLLHVGRLVKWKRVDMLIDVFSKLKKKYPAAELVVIGTGPEEEKLKQQARELGLADSVNFVGGVYDTALLGQYFMASTIYVLAGMGGLSINEAMCFDRPIVCSECDGTEKMLVYDEYNGKYFESGNVDDLYEKLDYLLSNPELTKKMGNNSGKVIREKVNIHTVIDGYVRAFNYVTENKFGIKYNADQSV